MNQMHEAFEKAGLVQPAYTKLGRGRGFSMTLTPFEIPAWILVDCADLHEAIEVVRGWNLNKVTTRCRDYARARQELQAKLTAEKGKEGTKLLNWRFHD